MPLTGIAIFKLLPKKNCGECGVPTCLAFAMSLAAGKAELSACPYISEEARIQLQEASAPPIRVITIGTGKYALKIGGETVMFRHEKRFENPTGIALLVKDTMTNDEIDARLVRFQQFQYQRMGLALRAELVAIKNESGDAAKFVTLVNKVKQNSDCNIILMSENPDNLAAGLQACTERRPLLYAVTNTNLQKMIELVKKYPCPVVVKGDNLEEVTNLTTKLTVVGINDLVIDSGARAIKHAFADQIMIRSAALNKKFRPLGFPTIVFPSEMTDDPMRETVFASMFIAKYGGIIVLSDFQGESLFPLLLERLNIYTDPQRPLATAEGIYEIGKPDDKSPVLLTANFSLTYFLVSGYIETSRVPAYLLIKDTEGLSVLTAWAAGKFVADVISPFVKKSQVWDKVCHRKLIIPGYVAVESGGLEEELSGWQILIGPRDGAHLPAYLKEWKV